jgi:hypothetical protein
MGTRFEREAVGVVVRVREHREYGEIGLVLDGGAIGPVSERSEAVFGVRGWRGSGLPPGRR